MSPRVYILIIIAILPTLPASADIRGLIGSYSYDFYNRTINVTSQQDYMVDKNNNDKNDTLIINITTDAASGNYKLVVEVIDENKVLVNNTKKTFAASDNSAGINFPSELLAKQKFNYSIRINDNDNNLVFRKLNIESHVYKNYETGTNVTKITNENFNNDFVL